MVAAGCAAATTAAAEFVPAWLEPRRGRREPRTMASSLAPLLALLAFMLIPVWIPIVSIALGAVADRLAPHAASPAEAAVSAAKERSASTRDRQNADRPAFSEVEDLAA